MFAIAIVPAAGFFIGMFSEDLIISLFYMSDIFHQKYFENSYTEFFLFSLLILKTYKKVSYLLGLPRRSPEQGEPLCLKLD